MKQSLDTINFDNNVPYKIYVDKINHFELHWHTYIELFYTMKGSIRITSDDSSFNLDEGHICFVNSGTFHSIDQTDFENEILILQISIFENGLFQNLKDMKFNHERYLLDLANNSLPLKQLQKILLHIYHEDLTKAPGYNNAILCLINSLITILIRHNYLLPKTKEDYIIDSSLHRLTNILDYIENHYEEKIVLKDLAEKEHMNYYYLSHFFKSTAGVSFQEYVNNLRLDKSLALLNNHNLSITKIALDCGFPNIKAYTNSFNKKFGMLPSKYRKTVLFSDMNTESTTDNYSRLHAQQIKPLFNSHESIDTFWKLIQGWQTGPKNNQQLEENVDIVQEKKKCISYDKNNTEIKFTFKNTSINETKTLLQIIKHLSTDIISEEAYSLEYTSDSNSLYIPTHERNIEGYSMLHSASILFRYFNNYLGNAVVITKPETSIDIDFFNQGNNFMAKHHIPTPGLYTHRFLNMLSGDIISAGKNYIITNTDSEIRILCYHDKSYETYLKISDPLDFAPANYKSFIHSYPTLKINFYFKKIKGKFKRLSYELNAEHGSILDSILEFDTIKALTEESIQYLQTTTTPKLTESIIPFSETPIVTIELQPLGCALIRLIHE